MSTAAIRRNLALESSQLNGLIIPLDAPLGAQL
jgi:hypothetical protein